MKIKKKTKYVRADREFTGQTYKGRGNNLDIDEIQLYTFIEPQVHTEFYAITKNKSKNAGKNFYLEGIINKGEDVKIFKLESDSNKKVEINLKGLEDSIRNVYVNLTTFKKALGKKESKTKSKSGSGRTYVSDLPENPVIKSYNLKNNGNHTGRNKIPHIRGAHIMERYGRISICSPACVHPERFTAEELGNFGFCANGKPTPEVVKNFPGHLTEEQKEVLFKRLEKNRLG